MHKIRKIRRIIAFVLTLCLLCTFSLSASAIVISPDFAPANEVLYSATTDEVNNAVRELLLTHSVTLNEDSLITIESLGNKEASIIHVTSPYGNTYEDTVLIGYFLDEDNSLKPSNFVKELLDAPAATGSGSIIFANVLVKGVTIYTRTTNGSRIYVRPTGQQVSCYDYGGTLPSSIRVNTQIQGILTDTSFVTVNGDYAYNKTFYKSSPAFGTTYSQSGGLSTSRWICPGSDVSYMLRLEAVINGSTHFDTVNIFSWL